MSETPRTDAAVMRQELDTVPSEFEYVDADFARQLERELAAANDRAARLERELPEWAVRGATQWLEREKHVFERGGIPYEFTKEDVNEMAKHFAYHASIRGAALHPDSVQKEGKP